MKIFISRSLPKKRIEIPHQRKAPEWFAKVLNFFGIDPYVRWVEEKFEEEAVVIGDKIYVTSRMYNRLVKDGLVSREGVVLESLRGPV